MSKKNFNNGRRAKKSNTKKIAIKIYFVIIIIFVIITGMVIASNKEDSKNKNNITQNEYNENIENTNSTQELKEIKKQDEVVSVSDMPKKIGNYEVIGKIVIDSIDVEKYILNRTTINSLDLSVTKFTGPEINEVGNFCITGHNYKNIFKRLKELEIGDEFYLVGTDGRKVYYKIYDKFSINPENEECLNQETGGKREVTLITCDPGAVTRLIIKAEEKI